MDKGTNLTLHLAILSVVLVEVGVMLMPLTALPQPPVTVINQFPVVPQFTLRFSPADIFEVRRS